MLDKIEKALTWRRRKWAYGTATAAFAVMGAYGIVTADQAAAWLLLAAAITGMATAKTTADSDQSDE